MIMHAPPSWFHINHYDYLNTCSPAQWYQELSTRRELKALFELRKNEPDIFITDDNSVGKLVIYEEFFKKLTQQRKQQLKVSNQIHTTRAPANIRRYIDFKIVPLFDLLHWFELNNESMPDYGNLKNWLFPDTEKHVRYIVGDAKKMLKLALLECDAFKYLVVSQS